MELLSPNDKRFSFVDGSSWLSYTTPIGKNKIGCTLRILMTGIVKNVCQYDNDYILNFTPLRLGWLNAKSLIMNNSVGTHKPCIASNHIPISKKLKEKEPITTYIYDASEDYFIDHTQMEKYTDVLEPGNVVVIDCGIQKFRETKRTNCYKVGFKIKGFH